jgi:hypothetical protein
MKQRYTPTPRMRALGAGQTRSAGDAGSADAVAVHDDTLRCPFRLAPDRLTIYAGGGLDIWLS